MEEHRPHQDASALAGSEGRNRRPELQQTPGGFVTGCIVCGVRNVRIRDGDAGRGQGFPTRRVLAAKAAELFGLGKAEQAMLNEVPHRGTPMPPTDPLIYRFYELVMVTGPAWKAPIEEI